MITQQTVETKPVVRTLAGKVWTRGDFPNKVVHWTPVLKHAVLEAVKSELFTPEEVMQKYLISEEELNEWSTSFQKHGYEGLKAGTHPRLRPDALPARAASLEDKRRIVKVLSDGLVKEGYIARRYDVLIADIESWRRQLSEK